MKLTYKAQLIATVRISILANILEDIFDFWIFRNIGFAICGLFQIIHPVWPKNAEVLKRTLLEIRIVGIILILIGILQECIINLVKRHVGKPAYFCFISIDFRGFLLCKMNLRKFQSDLLVIFAVDKYNKTIKNR